MQGSREETLRILQLASEKQRAAFNDESANTLLSRLSRQQSSSRNEKSLEHTGDEGDNEDLCDLKSPAKSILAQYKHLYPRKILADDAELGRWRAASCESSVLFPSGAIFGLLALLGAAYCAYLSEVTGSTHDAVIVVIPAIVLSIATFYAVLGLSMWRYSLSRILGAGTAFTVSSLALCAAGGIVRARNAEITGAGGALVLLAALLLQCGAMLNVDPMKFLLAPVCGCAYALGSLSGEERLLDWVRIHLMPTLVVSLIGLGAFLESHLQERAWRGNLVAQRDMLQEEKAAHTTLSLFLPKTIVEEVKGGEHLHCAKKFPAASVLFADVANFGSLTSDMEPEQVLDFLNRLFGLLDSIVDRTDLCKIETVGSTYMVSSGVPKERTDHAKAAVALALAFFSKVEENFPSIQLQIGIHSGPVLGGVVGVQCPRYRLFGDTVNTASRMKSYCPVGHIQISESTRENLMRHENVHFVVDEKGILDVKGKGAMRVYTVHQRSAMCSHHGSDASKEGKKGWDSVRKGIDARKAFDHLGSWIEMTKSQLAPERVDSLHLRELLPDKGESASAEENSREGTSCWQGDGKLVSKPLQWGLYGVFFKDKEVEDAFCSNLRIEHATITRLWLPFWGLFMGAIAIGLNAQAQFPHPFRGGFLSAACALSGVALAILASPAITCNRADGHSTWVVIGSCLVGLASSVLYTHASAASGLAKSIAGSLGAVLLLEGISCLLSSQLVSTSLVMTASAVYFIVGASLLPSTSETSTEWAPQAFLIAITVLSNMVALAKRQRILRSSYEKQYRQLKMVKLWSSLTLSMVPQGVFKSLLNHSKTGKMAEEAVPGVAWKFKNTVALQSDIVKFTSLASKLDPAEVVRLLHVLFGSFDYHCERLGVHKIETVGDGYIAAAACVEGEEMMDPKEACSRVVRLGLHMQDATRGKKAPEGTPLTLRVGIAMGAAVGGVVGQSILRC